MPKKRKLRENTDRREVWGANKKTADRYERERKHKNEVHALQAELANANAVIENLIRARTQLRRQLDAVAHPGHMSQLRLVIAMPFCEAKRLGLIEAMVQLTSWHQELEGGVVENVRQALAATDFEVKTIPNAPPLMPMPSGITKRRNDHDDPDSIDDLFAKAVDVHLERMDENHYWMGIHQVGGLVTHIDITWTKKTGLRAWVRR